MLDQAENTVLVVEYFRFDDAPVTSLLSGAWRIINQPYHCGSFARGFFSHLIQAVRWPELSVPSRGAMDYPVKDDAAGLDMAKELTNKSIEYEVK
jgi:hypothetical protein